MCQPRSRMGQVLLEVTDALGQCHSKVVIMWWLVCGGQNSEMVKAPAW